jgi:hypothetical protein
MTSLTCRKTTTMLFKMLGRQRAWEIHSNDMPRLRQIFVTKSRVLAGKVEDYFQKLLGSLATASLSLHELARLAKMKKTVQEAEDLIQADDDVTWRADLPSRFSLLKDEHFPLFITFDHVRRP